MFIGYSTTQKGYRCYDPVTRRVLTSRDVKFIESRGYYDEKNQEDLKDITSDKAGVLRIILENLGIKVSQDQTSGGSCPGTSPPPVEATEQPHLHHEGGEETGAQESSSDRRGDDLASHDQGGVETTQDGVETESESVEESSGDETQEEVREPTPQPQPQLVGKAMNS